MGEILDVAVGLLGGSGLGAIVGAVGSIFKAKEERRKEKQDQDHEYRMSELELKDSLQQYDHELSMADKQIERARTEGDIQQDIAETQAFSESLKNGLKDTGIKFVDAVRGLMRPVITVFMLIVSVWLAVEVSIAVDGLESLEQKELISLWREIIQNLMFLTMTAVTWWFGSRPSNKNR